MEEGDKCPKQSCLGILEYEKPKNCSCHIDPPCNECVDLKLVCSVCGEVPVEDK